MTYIHSPNSFLDALDCAKKHYYTEPQIYQVQQLQVTPIMMEWLETAVRSNLHKSATDMQMPSVFQSSRDVIEARTIEEFLKGKVGTHSTATIAESHIPLLLRIVRSVLPPAPPKPATKKVKVYRFTYAYKGKPQQYASDIRTVVEANHRLTKTNEDYACVSEIIEHEQEVPA